MTIEKNSYDMEERTMVEIKGVHGSEEAAAPLIVGVTTVYVHSNVEKVLDEEGQETGMYKYDEIQYTKDEWIKLMADRLTEAEDDGKTDRADIDYLLLINEV